MSLEHFLGLTHEIKIIDYLFIGMESLCTLELMSNLRKNLKRYR